MAVPAADDFDTIRARLEELKKEREEANKNDDAVIIPSPITQVDDMYCKDAFKHENVPTDYNMQLKSCVDINGISYPIAAFRLTDRCYP